jgi:nitroreductase
MDVAELVRTTRSVRRFKQDPIPIETLTALVDLARLSPSGGNNQPLKFLLSATPERNAVIFEHAAWAGLLKDWPGPAPDERPTAWIVILHDTEVSSSAGCDHGIAAEVIVLGAAEKGLGACMVGALRREQLHEALGLSERYKILLAVALGTPGEEIVLEDARGGDVAYYRDGQDRHHVPKRPLDEVLVEPDG